MCFSMLKRVGLVRNKIRTILTVKGQTRILSLTLNLYPYANWPILKLKYRRSILFRAISKGITENFASNYPINSDIRDKKVNYLKRKQTSQESVFMFCEIEWCFNSFFKSCSLTYKVKKKKPLKTASCWQKERHEAYTPFWEFH